MKEGTYAAFGLDVTSDFVLPGLRPSYADGVPNVHLRLCDLAEVKAESRPATRIMWETEFDRCRYRTYRGPRGEHTFEYGDRGLFHLSADGRTLLCASANPSAPEWQRVLLDTVLWTVSFLHGYELIHASAVELGQASVAFVTVTGGGKTSLASELLLRGARLLTDDVLAVRITDAGVEAHPGPGLMNLPLGEAGRFDFVERVATIDDECWVSIDHVALGPRPLAAICILDRKGLGPPRLQRFEASSVQILPHTLGLPSPAERVSAQFRVMGEVAGRVPIYRLEGDATRSPGAFADVVLHEFSGVAPAVAAAELC